MSECIEFARMSSAREFRGEYSEHLCPLDDDKRTKRVCFTSDTPEHVIEKAEAAATSEQAEADRPSLNQVPLTDAERESIDFSRDGVSVVKARYLKGLGEQYDVDPFQHVDLAEIDAIRDAEPILERARRTGGTGRGGGGAQYDDEATERERRERRAGAEARQAQECDHAEGHCEHGDPEACEYLREACGYDEEEVDAILPDVAGDGGPVPYEDLPGETKGALSRAWSGYKSAVSQLDDELAGVAEAFDNAERSARAIAGIEEQMQPDDRTIGDDPFKRLIEHHRTLISLYERHHGEHHGQPDGEEATQTGRLSDSALAEREPERPDHRGEPGDPLNELPMSAHPDERKRDAGEFAGIEEAAPEDAAHPRELEGTGLSEWEASGDARRDAEYTRARGAQKREDELEHHREQVGGGDDTDDTPEQFADDRQGTLGVDVEPEDTTGEKQVTLTGSDAGGSNVALPAKWTATATAPGFEGTTRHEAGPYSIEVTESDDRQGTFLVCLHAPEATEQLASGIRNPDRAVAVARGVADRVAPEDVSVHKSDATVPQAAADAMQATQHMAGGDQQPGLGGFGDD